MSALKRRTEKLDKIEKKLESYFTDGQFYEAEQLYKTIYNRLIGAEQYDDAIGFLLGGIKRLSDSKQSNSAVDLAITLLDCYVKAGYKPNDTIIQTLVKIFSSLPTGSGSDDAKQQFIKAAIAYTEKYGSNPHGDSTLHLQAAKHYASLKDYAAAHRHYLRSSGSGVADEHALLLIEWSQKGFKGERDLFIARAVLQYLCMENLRSANAIIERFQQSQSERIDTPLMHFINFLLKTVERDAAPLFGLLREKYAPSIQRDAAFDKYLNKIGEVYFDIKPPKDMMSSLMDMTKSLF